MPDASLLGRAADCYLRAGLPQEAARCYRAAGRHKAAALAWERLEAFREAAQDYAAAGAHEEAAWILVQLLADVPAARAEVAAAEAAAEAAATAGVPVARKAAELRLRLLGARCDAAEAVNAEQTLMVLDDAMEHIEHDTQALHPVSIEELAVAVATAMSRPDLVALVFAAAVRGGRFQAAQRWDEWSRRVLEVPLILPEPGTDPAAADLGHADDQPARG